jgi:lipoate---protein ligase
VTATPVPFRVIDTGVRDGRQHIAFDQALIELHREGAVPDTVRYLRFPPTVLIGRHQAMSDEARVEHCRNTGVGLVRRITGGGAIYLEENQVGWELVLSRKRLPMPTLADYTRAICEAAAQGLSQAFGIDARYRPRNDIEVEGQKLCGTGGFFDGDTLIYQGTVLIDVDPSRMMACLNALLGRAPSVADVNAAVLRGFEDKLGIKGTPGSITEREEALARQLHDEEIGTDDFVYAIDNPRGADVYEATLTGAGGTIAAFIRLEGAGATRRLREVLLTGDFFVTPPRVVLDLEAVLRGTLLADIDAAVDKYFVANKPDLLTIAPADFKRVILDAVAVAQA